MCVLGRNVMVDYINKHFNEPKILDPERSRSIRCRYCRYSTTTMWSNTLIHGEKNGKNMNRFVY